MQQSLSFSWRKAPRSVLALFGLSFAVLVAPLAASVLSSADQTDEGLASGINNAASRIAPLAGVAPAAGIASFESRFEIGLALPAAISIAGAFAAPINPGAGLGESGRLGMGLGAWNMLRRPRKCLTANGIAPAAHAVGN